MGARGLSLLAAGKGWWYGRSVESQSTFPAASWAVSSCCLISQVGHPRELLRPTSIPIFPDVSSRATSHHQAPCLRFSVALHLGASLRPLPPGPAPQPHPGQCPAIPSQPPLCREALLQAETPSPGCGLGQLLGERPRRAHSLPG